MCQSPRGKERTNEFHGLVFLCTDKKKKIISLPRCDSFLNKKFPISYYIRPEMFHFRDARQPQTRWHTSQNVKQEIAMLGTFKTSSAQQGSNDRGIHARQVMQHVQHLTLRRSGRRHSDADVSRRLQRRLRQT